MIKHFLTKNNSLVSTRERNILNTSLQYTRSNDTIRATKRAGAEKNKSLKVT
jgi:hypothetical protein